MTMLGLIGTDPAWGLEFHPILAPAAGGLTAAAWLLVLFRCDVRWGTARALARMIGAFPPLFTVLIAPLITYFFVCGSLSSVIATIITGTGELPSDEFFLSIMRVVEWSCSFVCTFIFCAYLRSLGQPLPSALALALSHAVVAGYRTAKYLVEKTDDGLVTSLSSGPKILAHFETADASFPLLALVIFCLLKQIREGRSS